LFSEFDCFFSNYLFEGFGGAHDWRYMIGIVAVPALVYSIIVTQIRTVPRLILKKRDDATAMKVLEMIYSKEDAAENFNEIKKDLVDSTFKETIFL
jgi:hypothetical protein